MITPGELQRARTVPEVEALLVRFRAEDKPDRDRIKQIEDEIKALRTEVNALRRGAAAGVTEDDILLKLGTLHAEAI